MKCCEKSSKDAYIKKDGTVVAWFCNNCDWIEYTDSFEDLKAENE